MREEVGDLFEYPCDALVVPCNWTTKRNGDAVMGAGVAKQAAERWPFLPRLFGDRIAAGYPAVWAVQFGGMGIEIVCFPTKWDWRDPSDLALIEEMAGHLVAISDPWETIALPRVGCGLGGLSWDDVRPVLEHHLDDRFVVVAPEPAR